MNSKPWDARLAYRLIYPFRNSRVTPNHFTTIRLVTGLAGIACFMPGEFFWSNLGALLFILSNFLDHTDGELARLTGQMTRFGHVYDLASDALIHVLLFVAIGVGQMQGELGMPAVFLGALAGLSVALIFHLRNIIESALGKDATRQPGMAGFEAEDVLYLMPLVTLTGSEYGFLLAASIGAPLAALIVTGQYLYLQRRGDL